MIEKRQIIDAIREVNRSASRQWLERFEPPALQSYLERLRLTLGPRGPGSIWVRPGQAPPAVTRRPCG